MGAGEFMLKTFCIDFVEEDVAGRMTEIKFTYYLPGLFSPQGPFRRVKARVGVFADRRAAFQLSRTHSWKQD